MKLNLLFFGADTNVGGVQAYVGTIAENLNLDLFNIHMTVSGDYDLDLSPQFQNVTKHISSLRYNPLSMLYKAMQLKNLIKRNKIDVIHMHTGRAGLLGTIASENLKVAKIYTGHGWRFDQKPNRLQRNIFYQLEKYICNRANIVTCISKHHADLALQCKVTTENKLRVVNTRIDAGPFALTLDKEVLDIKKKMGIPKDSIVIGTVARISLLKDPFTFVRIAKNVCEKNPNAYFLWVGDGELRNQVSKMVGELGIGDKFNITGYIPKIDIPLYMKIVDLYLCTSLIEGMPISILEAQASHKLVVSHFYKGIEEVIEQGYTGFVFETVPQAVEIIIKIIKNTGKYHEIANNAYEKFVELHSNPQKMAKEYESLYLEVINRSFYKLSS